MQRRTTLFIALGAAGVLGFIAVADSAFAGRRGGHGMHGGGHHDGMAGQVRSMAERYDLDDDGQITQEEIDSNRAEWHAEFSGDGDALTLEQFQALWLRARREQMVREFQRFDRDGDGEITLEEYQRPMEGFVERFDRNDDQALSRDDMQRRGNKHRRGGRSERGASNDGSQSESQSQE
jgi:hypothetical protein